MPSSPCYHLLRVCLALGDIKVEESIRVVQEDAEWSEMNKNDADAEGKCSVPFLDFIKRKVNLLEDVI